MYGIVCRRRCRRRESTRPAVSSRYFSAHTATARLPADHRIVVCIIAVIATSSCSAPTALQLPPPSDPIVVSGSTFSCLLAPEVDLKCWGSLGGGMFDAASPLIVPWPVDTPSPAAVDGSEHLCALSLEGEAFCWGSNRHGEVGAGTTTPTPSPTPVMTDVRFRVLRTGVHSTCAISSSGYVYCWGRNDFGALGLGTAIEGGAQLVPQQAETSLRFDAISGGWIYCALSSNTRAAYCWGSSPGDFGPTGWRESGDCSGTYFIAFEGQGCSLPTPVSGHLSFITLSVGGTTACGLVEGGAAYCWGNGTLGQLGDGTSGPGSHAVAPSPVAGGVRFQKLSVGATHACGLALDARVYCWGNNFRGYLGNADPELELSPRPVAVAGDHRFSSLAAGWYHTCGIDTEGDVWCWGSGSEGQLGRHASYGDAYAPIPIVVR